MTDTRQFRSALRLVVATLVVGLLAVIAAPAHAEPPTLGISGAAVEKSWIGGAPQFTIDARAAAGVRNVAVLLDGVQIASQSYECHDAWSVPCPQGVALRDFLPTTGVADGAHAFTVEASDSFGAIARTSATVRIDNHAPAPPADIVVEGGTGWRAQSARRLSWAMPAQQHAPIVAAGYRLCPNEAQSADRQIAAEGRAQCVSQQTTGAALTTTPKVFELPKPGMWTLRAWFVDAAGNSNADAAAVVDGLGFDPTPPEVDGFVAQDPSDPTRVTVAATDDVAPLAGGAIEYQRRGAKAWHPLATQVLAGGISASVDDERLRRGRYRLRATVVNAAGLQHGTYRSAEGDAKMLSLPIRTPSRLQAGRRVGKICSGRAAARRCRYRLARSVAVQHGRRITLRARLTESGRPIAHQALELWERVSVAGARWRRLAAVQTDGRGRVRYKAETGPARKLRFRYPGTPLMRGDTATIALHVQARSTFDVSRRSVINGEYVMFRGRLKGRPIPAAGLLVELQVRSRSKWRTFAQPRADAAGAWKYQYRFETVSGGARFRFRARVRRQSGYPYATGSSRVIGIRVHGL